MRIRFCAVILNFQTSPPDPARAASPAPSGIRPAGHVGLVRPASDYVTPRALETTELPGIVEAFLKGAENA
ncbi:MAG: hypothetical protein ABSG51_08300, partial [Terracidiphilus sp.]